MKTLLKLAGSITLIAMLMTIGFTFVLVYAFTH